MKKLVLNLFIVAVWAVFFINVVQAQNNPPKLNGVVYNPDGIELAYVEGRGDVRGFFIGVYEITQAQWKAIMGTNPSHFKGDNLPVESVGKNDAQTFIIQLNKKTGRNYRLPTGAEWNFAASGGTISRGFEYAGSNNINDVAWYESNSGARTRPVGTKAPNELGIFDMNGNVTEWISDLYYGFGQLSGGAWSYPPVHCRVNARGSSDIVHPNRMGFRIVLPY